MKNTTYSLNRCNFCPQILKTLKSCPLTIEITFWEILMITSSAIPYFIALFSVPYAIFFAKTFRSLQIAILLIWQNLVSEIVKYFFQEKRPEGACDKGWGFPSSHAVFTGSLITWFFTCFL